MAKATLELPNGTKVVVEGTPEEVTKLLDFYGGGSGGSESSSQPTGRKKTKKKASKKVAHTPKDSKKADEPDLPEIVNLIKNCDEAEDIETRILDQTSQVNRVLLPLYIVHEYLDNAYKLTSGEIATITTELGVPINQPNAAHTLSGTASKYVVGDRVRKKGQAVRYKMSRRGVKYLSAVIRGAEDDN